MDAPVGWPVSKAARTTACSPVGSRRGRAWSPSISRLTLRRRLSPGARVRSACRPRPSTPPKDARLRRIRGVHRSRSACARPLRRVRHDQWMRGHRAYHAPMIRPCPAKHGAASNRHECHTSQHRTSAPGRGGKDGMRARDLLYGTGRSSRAIAMTPPYRNGGLRRIVTVNEDCNVERRDHGRSNWSPRHRWQT